jgi:hypothetical protein
MIISSLFLQDVSDAQMVAVKHVAWECVGEEGVPCGGVDADTATTGYSCTQYMSVGSLESHFFGESDLLFGLVHLSAMQAVTMVMELISICSSVLLSTYVEMFCLFLYPVFVIELFIFVMPFSDNELSFVKFILSSSSE